MNKRQNHQHQSRVDGNPRHNCKIKDINKKEVNRNNEMKAYTGHYKTSQAVMMQQTARPQAVSAKMARTDFFAYICMFTTLFNILMEKKNKIQSFKNYGGIAINKTE